MYINHNPYNQSLYNQNSCSSRKIPFTDNTCLLLQDAGSVLENACKIPLEILKLDTKANYAQLRKAFIVLLDNKDPIMKLDSTLGILTNDDYDIATECFLNLEKTRDIDLLKSRINEFSSDTIGRALISDSLIEIKR